MLTCRNINHDPNTLFDSRGCTASPVENSFQLRFKEAYQKELDHFLDTVLDPSMSCVITRDDVLLSSRIAEACKKSQREGRMVELERAPKPVVL